MAAGSVALAVLPNVATLSLASGLGLVDVAARFLSARMESAYFRPLLEAHSVPQLHWKSAAVYVPFSVESRTLSIGFWALARDRVRIPSSEDLDEFYANVRRMLAASWFAEDVQAGLDYSTYMTMRFTKVFLATRLTEPPPLPTLGRFFTRATWFQLYAGAALLATQEPSSVKNPQVIKELARLSVKHTDEFIVAAADVGYSVA